MHSLLRKEKIRKSSTRLWDGAGLPPKDALRTRGAPSGANVTTSAAKPRRATTTTIATATPATGADDDRDADDDLVSHGSGSEQVRIRLKLFLFKKPGGLAPAGWLL